MDDLERAFPHGRTLMQAFPGLDPPHDEIANLEGLGADVVAVVAPQGLLVHRGSERGPAAHLRSKYEVCPPRSLLTLLIERQDPRGAVLDFVGKNRLRSIDEQEWGLTGGLGCSGADGP